MSQMKDRGMQRKTSGLFALFHLHHTARLFMALMSDRRVSWLLKVQAWAGLIYVFSPLDVLPDLFTGIGLLDDIIMALLIMQAFLELVPSKLVNERCERLGIDPEKVFINVPRTIRDAVELYEWAARRRQPRWDAPRQPAGERHPPEPTPPYTRYSAFQEDQP